MAEKKKIAAEFTPRYRKAGKSEKSRILDEYLAHSGSKSRKYALVKLNRIGKTPLRILDGQAITVKILEKSWKKRVYQPYDDTAVAEMLESLGKSFNGPCGKRFAPFIRLRENYRMSDTVADKLKQISPRTSDRLRRKSKQRMKIRGTSETTPVRLLHRTIPLGAGLPYATIPSGYFPIDLVQYDGGNPAGVFCSTLTMTDVKTGWTIHFARLNKAVTGVLKALNKALAALPRGLTGIHSDTGSECINRPVDPWCQCHGGACSRGCPTHKHDKCNVAQKKYTAVRKTVGYFRCMKHIRCERVGAKQKRTYDQAKTPFQRLLEQPFEDSLEERRVKMAALALKDATDVVGQ